jgi:hypothetical protein
MLFSYFDQHAEHIHEKRAAGKSFLERLMVERTLRFD